MMTNESAYMVRPPKQERSRLAWERVLKVGLKILETEGMDAVTIKEVCRQAGVTPPSLYARVDGLAGLMAAIFEHALVAIRETEQRILQQLPGPSASVEERVTAIVAFLDETFHTHESVLRPIVASAIRNGVVHPLGTSESSRVQKIMAEALGLPREMAEDIAGMVFAEVVIRHVYGPGFVSSEDETEQEFRARLTRMGVARARS